MNIRFIEMTFKNILSFGNTPTTINFKNGLNLITGKNGSGKSSALLDTLSFCLFGQPYRKIKIEELINRQNKKKTSVSCKFIINEKNTYEIIRGIKPSILTITENDKPLKLLSSKKLNQEEIESKIGINYKLFKQIISLSINHNEPFLDLSTPKKREIIEHIFDMDIIATMLKEIKIENKETKARKNILENTLILLKENITSEKIRIEELIKTKKTFEKTKQNDINDIIEKINTYTEELKKIKLEGKSISKELKETPEYDTIKIRTRRDTINKTINESEVEIRNCNKNIKFLEKHSICPTCKSTINENYRQIQLKELNANKKIHKDIIIESEKKLNEIDKKITLYSNANEKKNILKYKIKTLKDKFNNITSEIKELENKKEDIKKREFNININKIKKEYEEKKKEHNNNQNIYNKTVDEIDLNLKLIDMLSDTGIKSYIYEQLIPILNYNINQYLQLFELPVALEFDKFMEVNIQSLNTHTNNVSYYCFSEGEKKRIDMSILLSFIGVTKSIANWNCNLLIIDELLDSSIDEDGLSKLLESLENMINELENLGIYIISHRLKKEYFNQFNTLIEVGMDRYKFSDIKYLK